VARYVINVLGHRNFFIIVGNVNSLSLRGACWFDNPELVGALLHQYFELAGFFRQSQCNWDEIELSDAVHLLHPLDPFNQQIFPSDLKALWKLVDTLMLLQFPVHSELDLFGRPQNQPVFSFFPDGLCSRVGHLVRHRHLFSNIRLRHETVVFEGVLDQFDLVLAIELKVIAFIHWRQEVLLLLKTGFK
jgi:hypothetical protein